MSRSVPGAGVLALLAAGSLAGCTGMGAEAEAREVVEEYVALLGAGEAESADALDTFDPAASRCPELFTDEVYAGVPDRPTDLEVTDVVVDGQTATVDGTLVLGDHPVEVQLELVAEGDTWLVSVDDAAVEGSGADGVEYFGLDGWGEITVQGACPEALAGLAAVSSTAVYPGTWTVAYRDPAGIGTAQPVDVTAPGTLGGGARSTSEPVRLRPTASPEVRTAVEDAVAELVTACLEADLTGPACGTGAERATSLPPTTEVELMPATFWVDDEGEWAYVAIANVVWTDETGEHDADLVYAGIVELDATGAAVLTWAG